MSESTIEGARECVDASAYACAVRAQAFGLREWTKNKRIMSTADTHRAVYPG